MDGIIPLWKEKGMTSFDCVFQVRKIVQMKRVGHSGTLDPEVDGVLPICLGKATKVVEYLQDSAKCYRGAITLGFSTETEDAYGKEVERKAVQQPFSVEKIDQAMSEFIGKIVQVPPMYSAVKVKGKRLYEYARQNQMVKRPERSVEIYRFDRTGEPIFDEREQTLSWTFEVRCSKGTYVRTLAVDLGKKLGYPAHMSQLTRVESGNFRPEDCFKIEEIRQKMEEGRLEEFLYPIGKALSEFASFETPKALEKKIINGAVFTIEELPQDFILPCCFTMAGKTIALYDRHPQKQGLVKPVKIF